MHTELANVSSTKDTVASQTATSLSRSLNPQKPSITKQTSQVRQNLTLGSSRGVYLEVVLGKPVDRCCLTPGQAGISILPGPLSLLGNFERTPDANPHDVKAGKGGCPVVPTRLVNDHLIDNDVEACTSCGGGTGLVGADQLSADGADPNLQSQV